MSFLKKSYNLTLSRINATSANSTLNKSLVIPLIESLIADSQKVLTSINADFTSLSESISNNKYTVSNTKLVDNSCVFSITTPNDPIELKVPLILGPVCELKTSPNKYLIEDNKCYKLN
jgi:hypothetical protein